MCFLPTLVYQEQNPAQFRYQKNQRCSETLAPLGWLHLAWSPVMRGRAQLLRNKVKPPRLRAVRLTQVDTVWWNLTRS